MDNKQLDKIRARARAATGGPWGVEQDGRNVTVLNRATGTPVANCGLTDDEGAVADAEFIAEARTDIVDLADEVAALTTVRTALRREVYAVRRALDEARADRDRYRYALRSAVGNPADTEVRMTVPEVRRLAGLDPDTGRLVGGRMVDEPQEYRYCGATIDPPDGPTYTCKRRVAHTGPCSPSRDLTDGDATAQK